MRNFIVAPAIALSLSLAAALPDATFNDVLAARLNVPADQWMAPGEVIKKLEAQGYKVREIESDDGAYEVEMTDKNGVHIETHVHPATGALLHGHDD